MRWVAGGLCLMLLCGGCGRRHAGVAAGQSYADEQGRQVVAEYLPGGKECRVHLWDGTVQILQKTAVSSGRKFKKGSLAVLERDGELIVQQNETVVFSGKRVAPQRR
jgi:predicted Fe-S protein YdhL (DUF1289 family)